MSGLGDVQSSRDERNLGIRKVGVKDLEYPIRLLDRSSEIQHTIATVSMYVDLPQEYRGTHMSRFIEVLERHSVRLDPRELDAVLQDISSTFSSATAHIDISFPYFIRKKAPVSGAESYMKYLCRCEASRDGALSMHFSVDVPVNNLCPCSKEISEGGAHNQRGIIRIRVKTHRFIWYEELIETAEASASSPLYTILKREDEKYVTEQAYAHPRFVEDAAREVALRLKEDSRVEAFTVEVENMESIHNHSAYACITSDEL